MNKYMIGSAEGAEQRVRHFKWHCDEDNSVSLEWNWPTDRSVRLMLVFELDGKAEENIDIAKLIEDGCPHTVVTRELSSKYNTVLSEAQKRYAVCPAIFGGDKQIILLCPGFFTDIIYRKTRVSINITEKPLLMSRYKKVSWKINSSDGGNDNSGANNNTGGNGNSGNNANDSVEVTEALKYGIYEHERLINLYPLGARPLGARSLDERLTNERGLTGEAGVYIEKSKKIIFVINEGYEHLVRLEITQISAKSQSRRAFGG